MGVRVSRVGTTKSQVMIFGIRNGMQVRLVFGEYMYEKEAEAGQLSGLVILERQADAIHAMPLVRCS